MMTWPALRIGDPDRPALVFLHGFMGRGEDWLPAARLFSNHYHCILPDLPGHGDNVFPIPAGPYSLDSLADELDAFVDGIPSPIVLAGYSLGGRITLAYACRRPKKLKAFVLESASPGISEALARSERLSLDAERARQILSAGLPAFAERWYQAGLWASLQAHPDLLRATIADRSRNDAGWMAKLIVDLSPGRVPDLWPCLPQLDLPCLLLAGDLDPKYPQLMTRMAAHLKNARISRIDAAGHNIHLEAPEAFAGEVDAYLKAILV